MIEHLVWNGVLMLRQGGMTNKTRLIAGGEITWAEVRYQANARKLEFEYLKLSSAIKGREALAVNLLSAVASGGAKQAELSHTREVSGSCSLAGSSTT